MKTTKAALILAGIGALAGIVSVFGFIQSRKKNKLQTEVLELEKEMKELNLLSMKQAI